MGKKKLKMYDVDAKRIVTVPETLEPAYHFYEALARLEVSAQLLLTFCDFNPDKSTKQLLMDARALGQTMAGEGFSYTRHPPNSDCLLCLSSLLLGALPKGSA